MDRVINVFHKAIKNSISIVGIVLMLVVIGLCNPVFWLAIIAYILATNL